jgi:cell wall-associated NlpC family hydrolase
MIEVLYYAICQLSIVPVRANHSDTSEIVTQLIFGERITVIEEYLQWRKIHIEHDGYEGWIDSKQCSIVEESYFSTMKTTVVQDNSITIKSERGPQTIVKGSYLNNLKKSSFELAGITYSLESKLDHNSERTIESVAKDYLNAPYLWGGRTPFGIDCSGFTQIVFRFFNVSLKRDASQQIHQGEVISYDRIEQDDVVFFENAKGNITHVGIYLGDGKIIHAHGEVRIDVLSLDGITNVDSNELTHNFAGIRRYI